MSRKRKYDATMTGVIQVKVTDAQLDKFKNIPGGLDYLRTCIDTWSDGDEAQALEALRKMEKERDDLERRITEIKGRLTKKTSGEEQAVAKVLADYAFQMVSERRPSDQRRWLWDACGDEAVFQKVIGKLFPNGIPEDPKIRW